MTTGRVVTNIKRVRQSLQETQGRYMLQTRALARKMAAAGRDNVRRNISSPTFPGYAISGALAKKVVASEPQKTGNAWVATVRVLLTGKQKRYALIHETGGKIPVKSQAQLRAMFANLRKYGQVGGPPQPPRGGSRRGRLEYIRIRRKLYFSRGIERTRREWTAARLRQELGKV